MLKSGERLFDLPHLLAKVIGELTADDGQMWVVDEQ